MKNFKHPRGQALAEYMPVLTSSVFAIVAVAWLLSPLLGEVYNQILDQINGLQPSGSSIPAEPPGDQGEACVVFEGAHGGSQCDQHPDCTKLPGSSSGFFVDQEGDIQVLVIKAGQEYRIYTSGLTEDGCYNVTIEGNTVSWDKVGGGSACKDASHQESWRVPFCGEGQ